jgi:hypothetical protein
MVLVVSCRDFLTNVILAWGPISNQKAACAIDMPGCPSLSQHCREQKANHRPLYYRCVGLKNQPLVFVCILLHKVWPCVSMLYRQRDP